MNEPPKDGDPDCFALFSFASDDEAKADSIGGNGNEVNYKTKRDNPTRVELSLF